MPQLEDLQDLPQGCRVVLYGAGEFGVAFARFLRRNRPDVQLVCFADSFKTGQSEGLPVLSPRALAHEVLAEEAAVKVIVTAGDLPTVYATLQGVGIRRFETVGPLLRLAANAPEDVRYCRSLAEVPAGTAWTVVGSAASLERLRVRMAGGGEKFAVRAALTPDATKAPGEPPLLVLGSACYKLLQDKFGTPPGPVLVLDDPELLDVAQLLREQVDVNMEIWKNGYREGNPLDPLSSSKYNQLGWISSLHATHLACIKPYVGPGSAVLEIGCGGGAWSRALAACAPRELWCVDVQTAEDTGFWEYVGRGPGIRHVQVADLSCSLLPDGHFNYFFSFGCFCHLSPLAVREYLTNLAGKLKPGAHGFLMLADYEKFNAAQLAHRYSLAHLVPPALQEQARELCSRLPVFLYDVNEDQLPRPGRWYHMGTDAACELLRGLGMEILERDMGINVRDPLIHFRKL